MKKLIAIAVLCAASFAFAVDVSPFIDQSVKLTYMSEAEMCPHIGAEWKAHSFGAADISDPTNVIVYSGSAQTPTPKVRLNGEVMTNVTDFTFSYANNTNAGWATLKVTAVKAGTYGGQYKKFYIHPLSFTDSAVISNIANQASTGLPVKPTPIVVLNGSRLTADRDYEVSYDNNVEIGTNALVIVNGKGNYTGTVTKKFSIVAE